MNDMNEKIEEIVKTALQTNLATPSVRQYANIEEYTRVTGKRFRMTKAQKMAGVSREQAFEEFVTAPAQANA